MNDNRLRGPQWQRLLGEFLPPILGATPQGWAEANRAVAEALWQPEGLEHRFGHTDLSFAEYERYYATEWTRGSCRYLGLPEPDEDFCLELVRRVSAYVTPRVRSAFPGAVEAIRKLKDQGYTLHTASGETSYDLCGHHQGEPAVPRPGAGTRWARAPRGALGGRQPAPPRPGRGPRSPDGADRFHAPSPASDDSRPGRATRRFGRGME